MAQPAPYYPNNQQATYGVYNYSSSINPNIPNNSEIRGNYEPARASSFISSPATRIIFKQPEGTVPTSKVINNPVRYTPNIQPLISPAVLNTNNQQTVNMSRTEVIEHPVEVRTSTFQQAAPQASQNYRGAHTSYALPSAKQMEDYYPKWVWPTVALFGAFLLTLGFLWGLGVFGGPKIVTLSASTVSASSKSSTSLPVNSRIKTSNLSAGPTVAAPSGIASIPVPPHAPSRIYPQSVEPIQVKSSSITVSPSPAQPIITTPPTTTTQTITSSSPIQPIYTNSIPASIAPMNASSMTQPTTTTTTQVTTIKPSSIIPTTSTTANTQQASTSNAITQPTSTTTATTQPTSTAGGEPTTTVTTTVTTKSV